MHPALWGYPVVIAGELLMTSMITEKDANKVYADFAKPGGWNGNEIGCGDLANMHDDTVEKLSIQNQDPLGIQGKKVRMEGSLEGAVLLLNKYIDRHAFITAKWEHIGFDPSTVVEARDLWEHHNERIIRG
ncbi:unnamed protein product [Sphenostylis stenocarpa]|uniref:Alpha galactosidase C-terminal domain-containing protein n=1 Tax=Sphenostylis stenocarpa TaxID=92480 RepID=A0AA86T1X1_9FABA|nr:unnamed protein product [Sphenostylis stenocarpa]